MLSVCRNCGLYRADKPGDPSGPYAICPECGHKHSFRRLLLLMVSGAALERTFEQVRSWIRERARMGS